MKRTDEVLLSTDVSAPSSSRSPATVQTNCLSTIFFAEGLTQARKLDKFQAETGRTVGPLHGLPISLKDNLLVEGAHAPRVRVPLRPSLLTHRLFLICCCNRHRWIDRSLPSVRGRRR